MAPPQGRAAQAILAAFAEMGEVPPEDWAEPLGGAGGLDSVRLFEVIMSCEAALGVVVDLSRLAADGTTLDALHRQLDAAAEGA